jgi:hypothetical protein
MARFSFTITSATNRLFRADVLECYRVGLGERKLSMRNIVLFAVIGSLLLPGSALAQTPGPAATPAIAKPSISKFRARHVRHSCVTEAREHVKEGGSREEYVEACYSREVRAIGQRRECRAQGRAKGLSNQPLRDFVKQCASEQKG